VPKTCNQLLGKTVEGYLLFWYRLHQLVSPLVWSLPGKERGEVWWSLVAMGPQRSWCTVMIQRDFWTRQEDGKPGPVMVEAIADLALGLVEMALETIHRTVALYRPQRRGQVVLLGGDKGCCRTVAFSSVWASVSSCMHDPQLLDCAQKSNFATALSCCPAAPRPIQMALTKQPGLPPRVRPHNAVHRFTIDHVAPILTDDGIAHLDALADDHDGFAIGPCGRRTIAFAVAGGTGQGLGGSNR
jgi:hypothetical protein